MSQPLTPETAGRLVEQACLIEAGAPKPGNVHPGHAFHDMRYDDFVVSARAIAPIMAESGVQTLGRTILEAVQATRQVTAANTNLGMILLFAPMIRGALRQSGSLRDRIGAELVMTTLEDSAFAYDAIRLAGAGGLGQVTEQDLGGPPSVTLTEAMRLAADRDSVAGEYASDFAVTFGTTLPALRRARGDRLEWPDAVVEAFLTLLASRPDTLIARKLGTDAAAVVSEEARMVLLAGGMRSRRGVEAVKAFDQRLSDPHNSRNPGTTADLVAAAILAQLLEAELH